MRGGVPASGIACRDASSIGKGRTEMAEKETMTDDGPSAADRAGASGTPSEGSPAGSPDVRDVVGRRGYDEAEDETVTEDEQH